jgi:acyl-CoA thioesterase FadM
MILLCRVIVQAIASRFNSPVKGLTDITRIGLRVMPNDLDLNRHVNNGRIYSLVDLGRMDWFMRTGLLKQSIRRGWMPVVGDSTGRFIRQMKLFEKFRLDTHLLGWNERWLFLEHRLHRADGQLAAIIAVRCMFVGGAKGAVPVKDLLAVMGFAGAEPPLLPDWVSTWTFGLQQLSDQAKRMAAATDV